MGELIHESAARTIAELTHSLLDELVRMRDGPYDLFPDRDQIQLHCDQARLEMRTVVEEYVRTLRAEGVPPERALVLLKEAVQSGLSGRCSDEPVAEALLHDGVEWCITAYYEE